MKTFVILLTLVLTVAVNSYAQIVKLSLQKGARYEQTSTTNVKSVASMMGQEMENYSNSTNVQTIAVTNVAGGETSLAYTTTKIVLKGEAMGQEINYDSDKKDNTGPGVEEMGKSIGKVNNVTLNAEGKVIKEDDSDKSIDPMKAASSVSGKGLIKHNFIGRELKAGSSWPDSSSNAAGTVNTITSGIYTVKSVNEQTNIAVVAFNGTVKLTGTMEQMGQQMNMSSTSKMNAEYQLDIKSGIVLESSSTTNGTMEIEAGGMSIPVTLTTTTTSKLKNF